MWKEEDSKGERGRIKEGKKSQERGKVGIKSYTLDVRYIQYGANIRYIHY